MNDLLTILNARRNKLVLQNAHHLRVEGFDLALDMLKEYVSTEAEQLKNKEEAALKYVHALPNCRNFQPTETLSNGDLQDTHAEGLYLAFVAGFEAAAQVKESSHHESSSSRESLRNRIIAKYMNGEWKKPAYFTLHHAGKMMEEYVVALLSLEEYADQFKKPSPSSELLAITYNHWVLKRMMLIQGGVPPSANDLFDVFRESEDYKQFLTNCKSSTSSIEEPFEYETLARNVRCAINQPKTVEEVGVHHFSADKGKPLNEITDDDAIKVAEILRSPHAIYFLSDKKNMIESTRYWIEHGLISVFSQNAYKILSAFVYLQSKGYLITGLLPMTSYIECLKDDNKDLQKKCHNAVDSLMRQSCRADYWQKAYGELIGERNELQSRVKDLEDQLHKSEQQPISYSDVIKQLETENVDKLYWLSHIHLLLAALFPKMLFSDRVKVGFAIEKALNNLEDSPIKK